MTPSQLFKPEDLKRVFLLRWVQEADGYDATVSDHDSACRLWHRLIRNKKDMLNDAKEKFPHITLQNIRDDVCLHIRPVGLGIHFDGIECLIPRECLIDPMILLIEKPDNQREESRIAKEILCEALIDIAQRPAQLIRHSLTGHIISSTGGHLVPSVVRNPNVNRK